jgi:hypothetical protein
MAYGLTQAKDTEAKDVPPSREAPAVFFVRVTDVEQRQAWEQELAILKPALLGLPGTLYLEFNVPRLGSRIDAVLISGPAIFPIEFKCGERQFRLPDYHQAWDYALDLKNFHAASHDAPIFPVLVATEAQGSDERCKIFVPPGDQSDPTRAPAFYDDTYTYLRGLGLAEA